ncbi:MAG: alpha/beta hydrolase [Lysobacterales bacterium 69-70]|nr:alpha/beta fold hydrolase [Xanthomonadaceae bacterium]ODU35646.1 MAG: alpha/beta hydrolase [Xanthomonadaceae bacterium SCN 69-320]ODV22895.1 MAG: alpha/beta hydrolase [Xanthomonadaceae bacterium SCN 69-25]OJY96793.1 MAG: alpha/beta hydrolase [Xanthomonadales bacterium 69-70]
MTELDSAPSFPVASGALNLPGPAGLLETLVELPEQDARRGTAVICHPHPLHGGTMHNKVVTMLSRSLVELGLATVRFNFRGVGASAGSYDDGNGETDDLRAVVDWVRRERPDDALWLAGFSFGSYVALRAAAALAPQQLIQIAPPVGRWAFEKIALPDCPWLIVQGEADEVVDPAAVFAWAANLPKNAQLVRMAETSHFFHRRLMDLRGAVKHGVRDNLPPLQVA